MILVYVNITFSKALGALVGLHLAGLRRVIPLSTRE